MYDKLDVKVNKTDTSGFVLKTKCDADKSNLGRKIPNISKLVSKTNYNAKVSEIEGEIPSISGSVINSALTAVKNKISDVTNLVKKTNYDINITEIKISDHDKYITTSEFNKLTTENFAAKLAQANLVTKTDFDNKLTGFNKRNNSSETKHLLTENEFKKLRKIDSSYFVR